MEYRKIVNGIALGVLLKNPEIPDYHLMVGTAEHLDGVNLMISQTKIPQKVADGLEKVNTLSNEKIEDAIANNMLEINDYSSNNAILGSMIGGVR